MSYYEKNINIKLDKGAHSRLLYILDFDKRSNEASLFSLNHKMQNAKKPHIIADLQETITKIESNLINTNSAINSLK
tara:strand:+ start:924 stop:1154 length:231 start_codon:yes stop_codon:yes gene_type:complete